MNKKITVLYCTFILLIFTVTACAAATAISSEPIAPSFEQEFNTFLNNYSSCEIKRVYKLEDGVWAKFNYVAEKENFSYRVSKPFLPTSPYTATIDYTLMVKTTNYHSTEEEAKNDNHYTNEKTIIHKREYIYKNGQWIFASKNNI